MFIIIMWPAFLALVSPVTRKAKPTCMKSTRKPVSSSQVKLIETRRCPASLARALIPTCETGTSFFVIACALRKSELFPVLVPPASPLWLANWLTAMRATKTTSVNARNFLPFDTSIVLSAAHGR